ncbi:hypothetical protein FACS189414_4770 [Bacteroidia bacterium]|nr:hypothetical protein FACS189414_4770 [Bacteroidia bacterium]
MEDLTSKIKEILDTPDDQVSIAEAAIVLLQVNRNRILYQNIIRRNDIARLKYELQKIYNFRMQDAALEETKKMEAKAAVIVRTTFPKAQTKEEEESKGKRPDHDLLPDGIKAKFLENQNIFPRMRKLHEQLKLLSNAKACDRYEFLKELIKLDKELRKNWDEYDAYVIPTLPPVETPPVNTPAVETPLMVAQASAKEISAARKYISDNKAKLAELRDQEDQEKYQALLAKVQTRLDLLLKSEAGISEEQLNELKALGLDV